jgi:pimeloyl-ACP methyl ester carboxylesterase
VRPASIYFLHGGPGANGGLEVLVGHSWGAMLALCYAAEHPVERVVLVGCGTFDEASRAELVRRRNLAPPLSFEAYDVRGHDETWQDMMRLQQDGTYPARFARIEAPVMMLHGEFDEHPGP